MKNPKTIAILAFLMLTHCGVEAGNPGTGGNPTAGVVSLFFAKGIDPTGSKFSLNIDSIFLRAGSGTTTTNVALATTNSNLDLLATSNSGDVLAANSSSVPVGAYDTIVVSLAKTNPFVYKNAAGKDESVALDDASQNNFKVSNSFVVDGSQTTELVVDIDPQQSLIEGPDGSHYFFRPSGFADQRDRTLTYSQTTSEANAAFVCAYLYAPRHHEQNPADRPPETSRTNDSPPPPPMNGPVAVARPSFGSKSEVVKDTTADCTHAFARVAVVNDTYSFLHLVPGSYDFRLFHTDGTWVDLDSNVSILPSSDTPAETSLFMATKP